MTGGATPPAARRHDPEGGLAGERTDLAWNRSGIAVLTAVAVLLRRVWPLDRSEHVLALVLVTVGAGAWSLGLLAARSLARTTHRGRELPEATTLRWVTIGTVTLAVAAFLLGFFPPS